MNWSEMECPVFVSLIRTRLGLFWVCSPSGTQSVPESPHLFGQSPDALEKTIKDTPKLKTPEISPDGNGHLLAGTTRIVCPSCMDPIAYAQLKKQAGNQDFKNGNYSLAIKNYDEALQALDYLMQWVPCSRDIAVLLCNKSTALYCLGKWKDSMVLAQQSLQWDSEYVKEDIICCWAVKSRCMTDKITSSIGRCSSQGEEPSLSYLDKN